MSLNDVCDKNVVVGGCKLYNDIKDRQQQMLKTILDLGLV